MTLLYSRGTAVAPGAADINFWIELYATKKIRLVRNLRISRHPAPRAPILPGRRAPSGAAAWLSLPVRLS